MLGRVTVDSLIPYVVTADSDVQGQRETNSALAHGQRWYRSGIYPGSIPPTGPLLLRGTRLSRPVLSKRWSVCAVSLSTPGRAWWPFAIEGVPRFVAARGVTALWVYMEFDSPSSQLACLRRFNSLTEPLLVNESDFDLGVPPARAQDARGADTHYPSMYQQMSAFEATLGFDVRWTGRLGVRLWHASLAHNYHPASSWNRR